jgi:hypothetical protein
MDHEVLDFPRMIAKVERINMRQEHPEARLNSVPKKYFEAHLSDRSSEVGVSTPTLDCDYTRIAIRIGFDVDK